MLLFLYIYTYCAVLGTIAKVENKTYNRKVVHFTISLIMTVKTNLMRSCNQMTSSPLL